MRQPCVLLSGLALLLAAGRPVVAAPTHATRGYPALRVVKPTAPGPTLLRNGGFEATQGVVVAWEPWQKGFRVAAGAGRGASRAVVCKNDAATGELGAGQTVTLNRATVAPLVVRGWSKAEGVSGSPDAGYALYVDLTYADGTPLWGQTSEFRCGTHDWERREFVITPEKPVRSLTVYCLFRGHTGKVWFDDVSIAENRPEGDAVLFQGVPVQSLPRSERTRGTIRGVVPGARQGGAEPMTLATQDGVRLVLQDDVVTSLQVKGRELAGKAPSGFLARDIAAGSDIWAFRNGSCPQLALKVQAEYLARGDHLIVQGRLSDTTGRDRAVTLLFALPLDATGWRWGDDIRRSRVIEGRGEYASSVGVRCGATGTMSLYPLAALWDRRTGIALALDMGRPAQYRLVYHAGTKQLLVAYDFGLVKAGEERFGASGSERQRRGPGPGERFRSLADFRFVVYRFDPHWGFRAALRKLYDLYPEYFVVRSKEQGVWMPFTDVATVQGWQDFGFRYHEGDNNVPFDDAHGILSFRYTEPMTWWMPMAKGVPRTESAALEAREAWARSDDASRRCMAEVSRVAGMTDADGRPALLFRNEPWCDGAVWSLNPNPHLSGTLNAATVHWNDTIRQQLYGPGAKGERDGEYLDSLEGYVTAELNFRREHFRTSTVPLTFSSDTHKPALFKGLAVYEFTRWIAEDVHRVGKLTFANGVPYRFTFLCPWLDVMGTETDWLRDGEYQPSSDAQICLWRSMCGQKPYLLLMNTNFDRFTPDMVEKYFQRSLFYGIFPGMFSHNAADNPYWQNPRWYNRDRPLFLKYIPLIRRVAGAGWQPITEATCDNPAIFVERFGPDAAGTVYFTLMNESRASQSGEVTLETGALKLKGLSSLRELISGKSVPSPGRRFRVTLAPHETWAVEARP